MKLLWDFAYAKGLIQVRATSFILVYLYAVGLIWLDRISQFLWQLRIDGVHIIFEVTLTWPGGGGASVIPGSFLSFFPEVSGRGYPPGSAPRLYDYMWFDHLSNPRNRVSLTDHRLEVDSIQSISRFPY